MASISLLDVRSLALLLRFNTSLVLFNANYFRQQVERATEHAGDGLHWLVLDAMPITQMAVIGYVVVEKLKATLRQKGVQLPSPTRQDHRSPLPQTAILNLTDWTGGTAAHALHRERMRQ